MAPPAVERVPVELWLRIIRFALASPLIPAPGDDILDYRDVFLTVCDSDRLVLAHENNANSFRLVCKSWDTTVKKLGQKMILCDFGKPRRYGDPNPVLAPRASGRPTRQPNSVLSREKSNSESVPLHLFQKPHPSPSKLPPVTRIEAWTLEGYCHCFRSTCRYKKVFTSRDHPARNLQVAARRSKSTSTIESLLIGMKVDDNYLRSLLDAMPSLRALSCRIRDRPMWKTIFQRATCQRLTHLQVRVSWAPFCRSLPHIVLSELVYLGVILQLPSDTCDNANRPLNNVEWCPQPKLRYLELEGTILECRRDEFYAFLAVDRPNLSGLILRVHVPKMAESKYLVPPNLWASYPNLTSFGVEMAALLVKPLPPAPIVTSLDLILFFSTVKIWYHAGAPTADEFFDSIRGMCTEWKPKRIVLSTTWEAEEEFIKGFKFTEERPKAFYLPHYAQFFRVLKQEGNTVVDREGRSTETINGRRYVELLEVYGFDKYDNGLKLHDAWGDSLPKVPFKAGRQVGCYRTAVDSD